MRWELGISIPRRRLLPLAAMRALLLVLLLCVAACARRIPATHAMVRGSIGSWPGLVADGTPSAVAADEVQVYLGWTRAGPMAVNAEGGVRWQHESAGVQALGAEGGVVYVLGHAAAPASVVFKLDARSGAPLAWEGGAEIFLRIAGLWPADAEAQPVSADALAVGNGRLYLSFTALGFIAVIEARDGRYVTTLTGPQPGSMALSTTPMLSPDGSGGTEIADFGVAVLLGRAVSYFVMPHDPPWVAMNTTRWLAEDERIAAFTMRADTMKSGDVQLFFGLGEPQSQVQLRPAADPSGFTRSIGRAGGRAALGPWDAGALRGIRSLALDAAGRLWVAEGGACPKRFSVWNAEGELVREFFGPPDAGDRTVAVLPDDPNVAIAQGCEWRFDTGKCAGVIVAEPMDSVRFTTWCGRTALAVETRTWEDAGTLRYLVRVAPGDWRMVARVAVE